MKAVGNTDVTLDDTIFTGLTAADIVRGTGITEFTFRAVEDLNLDEDGTPVIETITVKVEGPNGTLEVVLTPESVGAMTRTEGAILEQIGNKLHVRAQR